MGVGYIIRIILLFIIKLITFNIESLTFYVTDKDIDSFFFRFLMAVRSC